MHTQNKDEYATVGLSSTIDKIQDMVEETEKQLNSLEREINENKDNFEKMDSKFAEWYISQRDYLCTAREELSEIKKTAEISTLRNEIFDLKTELNIFKFISLLEGIAMIAGSIIAGIV